MSSLLTSIKKFDFELIGNFVGNMYITKKPHQAISLSE